VAAPRFLKKIWPHNFTLALLTFFLINVTWVFFRSPDFSSAGHLLSSLFGAVHNGVAVLSTLSVIKVSIITVALVLTHWYMRERRVLSVANHAPWWLVGIAWAVMLIALILSQETGSSFIYFQF
jgi:alginate O-acetyltransferase complex protein AlgI